MGTTRGRGLDSSKYTTPTSSFAGGRHGTLIFAAVSGGSGADGLLRAHHDAVVQPLLKRKNRPAANGSSSFGKEPATQVSIRCTRALSPFSTYTSYAYVILHPHVELNFRQHVVFHRRELACTAVSLLVGPSYSLCTAGHQKQPNRLYYIHFVGHGNVKIACLAYSCDLVSAGIRLSHNEPRPKDVDSSKRSAGDGMYDIALADKLVMRSASR